MTDPISPSREDVEEARTVLEKLYVTTIYGSAIPTDSAAVQAIATALRAAQERGERDGIELVAKWVECSEIQLTDDFDLVARIRSLLSPQAGTEKK